MGFSAMLAEEYNTNCINFTQQRFGLMNHGIPPHRQALDANYHLLTNIILKVNLFLSFLKLYYQNRVIYMKWSKLLAILIIIVSLASCEYHYKQKAKKTIDKYMQKILYNPDSYHPIQYYAPARINITKERADIANSIEKDRNMKPFDGWVMAVTIEAITKNGVKSVQGANFYLNPSCDSIISSDVALYFRKD
jgi:hypothetical protein